MPGTQPALTWDRPLHLCSAIPPFKVDATASNLNSNDAFVLVTPSASFLWGGQGASDPERDGAQRLCEVLGVSASELVEGAETGEKGSISVYNNVTKPLVL